jgi:glutamine kinase
MRNSNFPNTSALASPKFQFGTKAETLERIKPLVSKCQVLDVYYFSVADWQAAPQRILKEIRHRFQDDYQIVVRSSAYNEDTASQSLAGAYTSYLNIDVYQEVEVREAIEKVIRSYTNNPDDQVLIQPMLQEVILSGVVMTYDLDTGAPYYILDYDDETGKTNQVTGGTGVNNTVMIYRDYVPAHIKSKRIINLLEMIREIEQICGGRAPLDIEFAKTKDGSLYLLQVRRITVQRNWNRRVQRLVAESVYQIEEFFVNRSQQRVHLAGSRTIMGQMPDWNPAELIGTHPRPLALSLFRYLISNHVWSEARSQMGYRAVPGETLMVTLAGHPYIDTRNSFNSFLPAGLEPEIEHRLIDSWIDRLDRHPEFHDQVEFQISQTVVDFSFDKNYKDRYANTLTLEQYQQYKAQLHTLTCNNLNLSPDGSLRKALASIRELEQAQQSESFGLVSSLWKATKLLLECRQLGTLPFSIIARHAFIAETFLRSAVFRGAISTERLEAFKRSLDTVAKKFTVDFQKVLGGRLDKSIFMQNYGHLRPGTFDILSLRYDQRDNLFHDIRKITELQNDGEFSLTTKETNDIATLLGENQLSHLSPENLIEYATLAIGNRERSKFVFTRSLSNALEYIAQWGEGIGLSRDDTSYLSLNEILDTVNASVFEEKEIYFEDIVATRRKTYDLTRSVHLGYIIRDISDIYVSPLYRGTPNFVTIQAVESNLILLDGTSSGSENLFDQIVFIENADPGFDWIFTRGIAGLVTKFGGANSHMTIRCAELGIPAAIGVGEQTFSRLLESGRIIMNCKERYVRPVYE